MRGLWQHRRGRATVAGFVLLFIIIGIAGGHKKPDGTWATRPTAAHAAATSTPTTAPTASAPKPRTAPRRAAVKPRRAHPRPRALSHPELPVGLALSTASNAVVQSQPAPGSCHARGAGLFSNPDPRCTPGALNPAVTQATIASTICLSGWTKTVRPSESVTEPEKLASMAAYGDAGSARSFEYDHFVPLELGGATNDARNLWPEPGDSPNPKDAVEDDLHHDVCAGQMTLAHAQNIIITDWVSWAHSHVTSLPSSPSAAPPATTTQASPPPSPSAPSPSSSSVLVVHPGAFCSPEGAHGVTDAGTAMTCKTSATDSRDRWRHS